MKALLFFCALSVCAVPLLAAPTDKDKPIRKDGMVMRTNDQDARLRDWIVGLQTENRLSKESEKKVQAELVETKAVTIASQKEVNRVTDDRNKQAAEKDKAYGERDYWHQKQTEALAKLWWWRFWGGAGIVIGILLITGGLLIRFSAWGAKTLGPFLKPV